jgi:hypothetical protein
VAGIARRLERLEGIAGVGGGCNKCRGAVIIRVDGEVQRGVRDGVEMPLEEARALSAGECPECKGQEQYTIRLKGLDEKPGGPAPR